MDQQTECVWEYAKINPNGFTLNIKQMKPVLFGISAAYKATQDSFGKESLDAVIAHASKHDNLVGGWTDFDTGFCYLDSVRVFKNSELKQAIEFAEENEQIAIFDITNLRVISIKRGA